MIPPTPEFELFRGLHFFEGSDHLPPDLLIDLETIRSWAGKAGLIADRSHVLTPDRLSAISRTCSRDDGLLVAIALSSDAGSLGYHEYAYLPVKALVRRGEGISLTYWRMTGTGVKLRFRLATCTEEFCAESTAARVVPKFAQIPARLGGAHATRSHPDGTTAITVDGSVRAVFRREGRTFDVDLTHDQAA